MPNANLWTDEMVQAAIADARQDERRKCVAEVKAKADDLEIRGWKFCELEIRQLVQELTKGLTQ